MAVWGRDEPGTVLEMGYCDVRRTVVADDRGWWMAVTPATDEDSRPWVRVSDGH